MRLPTRRSAGPVGAGGSPQFSSEGDRQRWFDEGAPGRDTEPTVELTPPGGWDRMWNSPPPSDVENLRRYLRIGHPAENGPYETLIAVEDLHRDFLLDRDVRSAVLRVLATLDDLRYAGTVTDRAGRRGQAFHIDSDGSGLPTRYTVIFDAGNGELLATEQVLTKDAGKLNVRIPAVVSYTIYLETGWRPEPRA